jgi:TAG lipase/steryl ester hydrolase/phospholipase A2/LPA acyltransferase
MKGKKLMARDHQGHVVPYDATGNEWVDGSIQHDLPMETMASCFNVTNFIVSQVNPHVVPFMGDDVHQPLFRKSLFHTLESVVAADVRHRLKMLAFLGLFPKIYGHQFSSYFEQNFSGNVTLIPEFIFLEAIGVKAILNPTREDMDRYLLGGQRAVWPKLAFISHLCAIEKCLDKCLSSLDAASISLSGSVVTSKAMRYENWLHSNSSERAEQASELLDPVTTD